MAQTLPMRHLLSLFLPRLCSCAVVCTLGLPLTAVFLLLCFPLTQVKLMLFFEGEKTDEFC